MNRSRISLPKFFAIAAAMLLIHWAGGGALQAGASMDDARPRLFSRSIKPTSAGVQRLSVDFNVLAQSDGSTSPDTSTSSPSCLSREGYALRMRGLARSQKARPAINGKALPYSSVRGKDSAYWFVPASFIQTGANQCVIENKNAAPSASSSASSASSLSSVSQVELIALESFEADHFGLAFAAPELMDQPAADPNQNQYDVLHYQLDIRPDYANSLYDPDAEYSTPVFAAKAEVEAKSLDSTLSTFVLDFDHNGGLMVMNKVEWIATGQTLAYTWDDANDRIRVTLPSAIAAGETFAVRFDYQGKPNQSTGVFDPKFGCLSHSGTPMFYTFSEPYGARTWFPCKDIPSDKTTVGMSITVPPGHVAIANGSLQSTVENDDGTLIYTWRESYPLATYLICFGATNYVSTKTTYTALDGVTTMDITHWGYPESSAYIQNAPNGTREVMEFFAGLWGEFPFLREKYCTYTHGDGGGMEHQTCTGMPNENLLNGNNWRRNIHELAHSWFGDMITMNHFDHLWLNEGFAKYAEALWTERTGLLSPPGYTDYIVNQTIQSSSDSYVLVSGDADGFSSSLAYNKGMWVLHMLRRVMGDTAFFQGMRAYAHDARFKYGTAVTEDFQGVMQAASGMDLSAFFYQWCYRNGRPSYTWSWSTHQQSGTNILNLYISHTTTDGAGPYTMPVDFKVTFQDASTRIVTVVNNASPQEFHMDMGAQKPTAVVFDPNTWILKRRVTAGTAPATPTSVATSTPTSTPGPSFTPTLSPTPELTATPPPTTTPTAAPSPTPSPSPSPTPQPTPRPAGNGLLAY